jgi:hypothetical protein
MDLAGSVPLPESPAGRPLPPRSWLALPIRVWPPTPAWPHHPWMQAGGEMRDGERETEEALRKEEERTVGEELLVWKR